MFKKIVFSVCALAILGGMYLLAQPYLANKPKGIEKITIADARFQSFGLVYIALQNGYFKDEGVDVTFNTFALGKDALADVAVGNSDIATVFEVPLIRQVYAGQDLKIISSLHKSNRGTALVVSKKKGVKVVSDLKGKKIAVVKGTNAEFFLFSTLVSEGIGMEDVTIVDTAVVDIKKVLANGSVDAVAIFHPQLYNISKSFDKEEIEVIYSDTYTENSVLAGKTEVIKNKQEALTRVLRALVRAEDFYKANKEESIQLIAKSLEGTPEVEIRGIWPDYQLSLDLDNVLLTILNREARWFRDNGVYTTEVPDFTKVIFSDYLKSVKSEAVTLF